MLKLNKNEIYDNIYFSGCAYLNMFQLGVILCFMDNNIRFRKSYSTSAGFVPSIGVLSQNESLFEFLVIAMLKSRFSNCFFFGHHHMSMVMKDFIDTCFDNFDLSFSYKNIFIGAKDLKLENIWFQNFENHQQFTDAIISTTRLLPFISLIPYKSNEKFYMDQIWVSNIPDENGNDIIFDVAVCPFNEDMPFIMPQSFCKINGQNTIFEISKILNPSYNEMLRQFIIGYNQCLTLIYDPKSRDIYSYVEDLNIKYNNWDYVLKHKYQEFSMYENIYYKIRNFIK